MEKIITFGEIMLRLSTPDYNTINQTHEFLVNYGGGEANVSVALAHLGHNTSFITKLPPNQLGDGAIMSLKSHGVDTSYIARGSSNIGIYFLETGFGGRSSKVIYNRKHSAITRISEDEFDWDSIFSDASWFHLSGITLALGERVRRAARRACIEAKRHNVSISFDFNYRSKLWSIDEARATYKDFMQYFDVCFMSFYDANTILEVPLDKELMDATISEKRRNVFPKLIRKYNLKYIFGTDRVVYSATENSLAGYYFKLHEDGHLECLLTDPIRFNIYDRIGGGDAFASGVIHGLLRDYNNPEYAVKFGLNLSVLKHTVYGDASVFSEDDVLAFMNSKNSAEVKR